MAKKDEYALDYASDTYGTFGSQRPENQVDRSGNVLDQAISQQNVTGLRPASAAQLDPNAGPGGVTVVPVTPNMPFTGWEQDKWAENQNPAQLRESLNLDILRSKATQNRMAIEQAETMNPLQTRLAQARINATGAHQNFMEYQDAQALEHTANFLNDMADPNAPAPNSPGYAQHVMGSLIRNPRFAHSAGGREMLKELARTHDTHLSVEDLRKQLPEGFGPSNIRIGPNGVSMSVSPVGNDVGKELGSKYGLKLGDFKNPASIAVGDFERTTGKDGNTITNFKGSDTGKFVRITKSDGKGSVTMPVAEFEALGGQYSPETLAKRGGVQGNATGAAGVVPATTGVKNLGRYNPSTGNFEK